MSKKTEGEDRLRQILKVARMFYREDKSKTEISYEIKASTTQVARLLEEALTRKIVNIDFSPPKLEDLEYRLKKEFDWLREVVVIPFSEDLMFLREMLAKATADYFVANVDNTATVALGGGDTLYEMVMALPDKARDITIVPTAIVDTGPRLAHVDPAGLVTLLWVKCGRKPDHAFAASGLPPNQLANRETVKKEYAAHSNRSSVKEVCAKMKEADFVFAGLGCLTADADYEKVSPRAHNYLLGNMKASVKVLTKEGAVGDVNYSFFDQNGATQPNWNIFPALGVEELRQMSSKSDKQVIVTVGKYKMPALKAALKGKIFNVLITDEEAAEELLRDEGLKPPRR